MYSLETLIAFVGRIKNEEMALIALDFINSSPKVGESARIAIRNRIWDKIENKDYK